MTADHRTVRGIKPARRRFRASSLTPADGRYSRHGDLHGRDSELGCSAIDAAGCATSAAYRHAEWRCATSAVARVVDDAAIGRSADARDWSRGGRAVGGMLGDRAAGIVMIPAMMVSCWGIQKYRPGFDSTSSNSAAITTSAVVLSMPAILAPRVARGPSCLSIARWNGAVRRWWACCWAWGCPVCLSGTHTLRLLRRIFGGFMLSFGSGPQPVSGVWSRHR